MQRIASSGLAPRVFPLPAAKAAKPADTTSYYTICIQNVQAENHFFHGFSRIFCADPESNGSSGAVCRTIRPFSRIGSRSHPLPVKNFQPGSVLKKRTSNRLRRGQSGHLRTCARPYAHMPFYVSSKKKLKESATCAKIPAASSLPCVPLSSSTTIV